jgi:hypothetical protein
MPNGSNVAATKKNRFQDIYLISHDRLSKQIKLQSEAFFRACRRYSTQVSQVCFVWINVVRRILTGQKDRTFRPSDMHLQELAERQRVFLVVGD